MPNTKTIGERSEAMILAALLRAGKVVLQPFGDNQRYDLVVDEGGTFLRVQCKTAHLKDGCVVFSTCSSQTHRGRGKQSYLGQADYFGVYSPDLDKVYVLPVKGLGGTSCALRVAPLRRNRTVGLRFAGVYEFKGDFPALTSEPSLLRWPSDEELLAEVQATSLRAVAARLGCSHVAVGKRLGRYRKLA